MLHYNHNKVVIIIFGIITLLKIQEKIIKTWNIFEKEDFIILVDNITNLLEWPESFIQDLRNNSNFYIITQSKNFLLYKKLENVFNYGNINDIILNNIQFISENLVGNQIEEEIQIIYNEIQRRTKTYDINLALTEYTVKEFINIILIGSLILYNNINIKIITDNIIIGKKANGLINKF